MAKFTVTAQFSRTVTGTITREVEASSFGEAEAAAGTFTPSNEEVIVTAEDCAISSITKAPGGSRTVFPPAFVAPTEENYMPMRRQRVAVDTEDVADLPS